jgi:hypothetical protein
MAGGAQAATLTVTNTNPSGAGSLLDRLITANGDPSADTIVFQSGVTGTITVGSPLPVSGTNGITIQGPGASVLAISGGDTQQVFAVTSPRSDATHNEIDGLTITHGHTAANGGAIGWIPGSSSNQNHPLPLTLNNDVISDSVATGSHNGGGIYSEGPLSLSNTTVTGNTSGNRGGGISLYQAGATLTNSTVSGNTASNATGGASGGGIDLHKYAFTGSNFSYNAQTGLSLVSSQVTGNHAIASSGGSSAYGGGISDNAVALSVQNSTVSGNSVSNTGTGPAMGGGVSSFAKYGVAITGSTISGNTATVSSPTAIAGGGGLGLGGFEPAIYLGTFRKYAPTVVQNTTISGNQASQGAGIDVGAMAAGARTTIDHSTITGNTGGPNSFGGGIGIYGNLASPFSVVDSTLSGNTAATGGAVSIGTDKHAQLSPSVPHANGSVTFDNSTIAANSATAHGGGIYLGDYQVGGGSAPKQSGTIVLGSTIVSGNKLGAAGQDLERVSDSTSGGFSADFSLVQNKGTAPVSGNQLITGVDPQLGALGSNGGPTRTMKPAGTSPVIDQGHVFSHLSTDQIGGARTVLTGIPDPPGGDGTDIGAVELAASQVVVPPPFSVNILSTLRPPGTPLGTGKPLLIGTLTPVKCAVRTGTLSSCAIVLRYRGKVVGQGNAGGGRAASSLSTTVDPTSAGTKALSGAPLGLDVQATAFGPANGAQVTGTVHFLGGPSITLPIVGRSKTLSNSLKGRLGQAASLLTGVRTVTCTAYTDKTPTRFVIRHHKRVALPGDSALTTAQAKAACNTLKSKGLRATFRSVGGEHSHEVASDRTARGRAANRRLVITFRY